MCECGAVVCIISGNPILLWLHKSVSRSWGGRTRAKKHEVVHGYWNNRSAIKDLRRAWHQLGTKALKQGGKLGLLRPEPKARAERERKNRPSFSQEQSILTHIQHRLSFSLRRQPLSRSASLGLYLLAPASRRYGSILLRNFLRLRLRRRFVSGSIFDLAAANPSDTSTRRAGVRSPLVFVF